MLPSIHSSPEMEIINIFFQCWLYQHLVPAIWRVTVIVTYILFYLNHSLLNYQNRPVHLPFFRTVIINFRAVNIKTLKLVSQQYTAWSNYVEIVSMCFILMPYFHFYEIVFGNSSINDKITGQKGSVHWWKDKKKLHDPILEGGGIK